MFRYYFSKYFFFGPFSILILRFQFYLCWTTSQNPVGDLRIFFFSHLFSLYFIWDRFYCCVLCSFSLSNLLISSSEIFISDDIFFIFRSSIWFFIFNFICYFSSFKNTCYSALISLFMYFFASSVIFGILDISEDCFS